MIRVMLTDGSRITRPRGLARIARVGPVRYGPCVPSPLWDLDDVDDDLDVICLSGVWKRGLRLVSPFLLLRKLLYTESK